VIVVGWRLIDGHSLGESQKLAGSIPVPESATVCGLVPALSVKVSVTSFTQSTSRRQLLKG
jgi:hypothetical protein